LTKQKQGAERIIDLLQSNNVKIVHIPLIKIISSSDNYTALDNAILSIRDYGGIVFTSPNAVRSFFSRIENVFSEINILDLLSSFEWIAAVGQVTKDALSAFGVGNIVLPDDNHYSGAGLAKKICKMNLVNKKILFPASNIYDDSFPNALREHDFCVDYVEAYQTVVSDDIDKPRLKNLIASNKIDIILFHSPSAVRALTSICNKEIEKFRGALYCIGKTTYQAACKTGETLTNIVSPLSGFRIHEFVQKDRRKLSSF